MQKILVAIISVSIAFMGCVSSTGGGIPTSLVDGTIEIDNDISDLQDGQTDSLVIAQEITDIVDTAIDQLERSEDSNSEFTDIIQRIQAREPVNYIEPTGGDNEPYSAGAGSKEPAE